MQPLLKTTCRRCRAAIAAKAYSCPMCGLLRPNAADLNVLEQGFLDRNPVLPSQYQELANSVDPRQGLLANLMRESGHHLTGMLGNPMLFGAFLAAGVGGIMVILQIALPLTTILCAAGVLYLGYDALVLLRSVLTALLLSRLQMKRGLAPYSVHFKLEAQLVELLESLRTVVGSILERDWNQNRDEMEASADCFLTAVKVLTDRIRKNARVSLETSAIIWRNNVYALLAMESTAQEKALAIAGKLREGEALLVRFHWLVSLGELPGILRGFLDLSAGGGIPLRRGERPDVMNRFQLTPFGPVAEACETSFEGVPYQIPFLGRYFWHQRLPPFPLKNDGSFGDQAGVGDFFESLEQVRRLQIHLQDQMVLTCVAKAVSNVSMDGYSPTIEADEMLRDAVYRQFLEIPRFRPDSREVQEEVDRLSAEARVSLGAEEER